MSQDAGPLAPEPLPEPTAALPDDPAILQQMVLELLDVLRQTRRENEELQHRLDLQRLKHPHGGKRVERVAVGIAEYADSHD